MYTSEQRRITSIFLLIPSYGDVQYMIRKFCREFSCGPDGCGPKMRVQKVTQKKTKTKNLNFVKNFVNYSEMIKRFI